MWIWIGLLSMAMAGQKLAVLDLVGNANKELRLLVADELRSGLLPHLKKEKVDLLTRENLLAVLQDMGKDASCVDGDCEVEIARNVGADYVLSGRLSLLEKSLVLSIKLHASRSGKLLSAERISANDSLILLDKARQLAQKRIRINGPVEQENPGPIVSGKSILISPKPKKGALRDNGQRKYLNLSRDFYIGIYEVSIDAKGKECKESCPARQFSFSQAVDYANERSAKDGLSICYQRTGEQVVWLKNCTGWRLPTEDEWEYAALGGEDFPYAGSGNIDSVAWYSANSQGRIHPVGIKKANAYGLYDMSGNVWEWTWPNDGSSSTRSGILRGGGSIQGGKIVDSLEWSSGVFTGLRLVRTAH